MSRHGLLAFSLATLAAASSASAQAPVVVEQKVPAIQVVPAATADVKVPDAAAATPAVGEDKKADVAAAPTPPAPPPVTLVAKIDLATQRMTVLENGKAKFTWSISSGARGYDTPRGNFQPGWMAKEWFSKQYDNAPMPHAVFFKDGAAIHATMNTGSLGRPASHGCVRLAPSNAATFYGLVRRHTLAQTRVHVFGAPRHAPEMIASRPAAPSYQQVQRVAYAAQPTYAPSSFGSSPYPYPGSGAAIMRAGAYNGYGAYSNHGSAFAPRKASAPRNVQVRVVNGNGRGVRY